MSADARSDPPFDHADAVRPPEGEPTPVSSPLDGPPAWCRFCGGPLEAEGERRRQIHDDCLYLKVGLR